MFNTALLMFAASKVKTPTGGGELWAWGSNHGVGTLGNGETTDQCSPIQIGSDSNWIQVGSGQEISCAKKSDGTVWTWGKGASGGLGHDNVENLSSPVQLGSDTDIFHIIQGQHFTYLLKDDGTLWATGENGNGQLGLGDTTDRSSPVQIGSDTDWNGGYTQDDIDVMDFKMCPMNLGMCIIRSNSTLWTWGSNSFGS